MGDTDRARALGHAIEISACWVVHLGRPGSMAGCEVRQLRIKIKKTNSLYRSMGSRFGKKTLRVFT